MSEVTCKQIIYICVDEENKLLLTSVDMHFVQGILVLSKHAHIRAEFFYENINNITCACCTGHPDTFCDDISTSTTLKIKAHNSMELQLLQKISAISLDENIKSSNLTSKFQYPFLQNTVYYITNAPPANGFHFPLTMALQCSKLPMDMYALHLISQHIILLNFSSS